MNLYNDFMKSKWLIGVLLFFLLTVGFYFRLKGISDNHSFWQDEAFAAVLSRDVITNSKTIVQALQSLSYQPFHVLTVTIFMKIFGISEFAARLPSVIYGTLGILAIYLLVGELADRRAGLFGAFFYTFFQMNLANSIQAKPYAAIETLFLFAFYILVRLDRHKKNFRPHIAFIFIALLSSGYHYLGALVWIPYLYFLVINSRNLFKPIIKKPVLLLAVFLSFLIVFLLVSGPTLIANLFTPIKGNLLFPFNNMMYLKEIFLHQYLFITIPVVIEIYLLIKSKKSFGLSLGIFTVFYLYLWTFKQSTHNMRYILPLFGVLVALFATFWGTVATAINKDKMVPILLIVTVITFISGYKIVRKPANYYTPNNDLYGDVQIADYKSLYKNLKINAVDYKNIAIFNDWGDAQNWYLDKPAHAYFIKGRYNKKPEKHSVDQIMIYGSLSQFLEEKLKYKSGILIVEDWESLLPEDIKQYAKKNMKLEIRIDSLAEAKNDPWPLEVYSWGL